MTLVSDTGYWDDPYYSSPEYAEKLRAAENQERNRQELNAGVPSKGALAYARFLIAVENDATFSPRVGGFKKFAASDQEVFQQWPFLQGVQE